MPVKTKDIRAMSADERAKTLTENRTELMHERGQAAMGGAVKNPGRIRDLRTTIARILTIETELHDPDIGSRHAPAAAPGAKPKPAPRGGAPKPARAKEPAKAAAKKPAKEAAKPAGKSKASGAKKSASPKGGPPKKGGS